jgi:hypothetical protein
VPYQKGDIVRFANTSSDTIVLTCTYKEFTQYLYFTPLGFVQTFENVV